MKPTAQQIKIAEGLATHGKKIKALTDAGVSKANARSNSKELTEQPGVRKALIEALRKASVGVDRIAMVVNEGLSAKKVISATVLTFEPKKDQPEIFDASKLSDLSKRFLEVPDHAIRHQFVRTASELLDAFPATKIEDVTPPVQEMPDAELDKRIKEIMSKQVAHV